VGEGEGVKGNGEASTGLGGGGEGVKGVCVRVKRKWGEFLSGIGSLPVGKWAGPARLVACVGVEPESMHILPHTSPHRVRKEAIAFIFVY
jgi:hypothetical protein